MRDIAFVSDKKPPKLISQFWKFHRENPHIYEALLQMTCKLYANGVTHSGMARLFEVLRYDFQTKTQDTSASFKLCNAYRAFYARLIEKRNARFAGFFGCHASLADEMFDYGLFL